MMRWAYLFFVFIISCTHTVAQLPKLLPDSSAVWEQGGGYQEYDNGIIYQDVYAYAKFVIIGDTLIDSTTYKNLYLNKTDKKHYDGRSGYNFHQIIKYGLTKKVGVLKQDSLKVSIRIFNDSFLYVYVGADSVLKTNTDYTLYDFGKTAGDTIYPAFGADSALAWVISKDTTVESKRVLGFQQPQFYLTGKEAGNYLVEGMGFTRDFFTPLNKYNWKNDRGEGVESWGGVQYFCLDKKSIPIESSWQDCDWDTVVIVISEAVNNVEAINISVYPNPASSQIFITNLPKNSQITLTDISGKIAEQEIASDNWVNYNIADLPAGVYVLTITTKAGVVVQKILKQ